MLTLNIEGVHGDTPALAVASAKATFCTWRTSVALPGRRSVWETPTSSFCSADMATAGVEESDIVGQAIGVQNGKLNLGARATKSPP